MEIRVALSICTMHINYQIVYGSAYNGYICLQSSGRHGCQRQMKSQVGHASIIALINPLYPTFH